MFVTFLLNFEGNKYPFKKGVSFNFFSNKFYLTRSLGPGYSNIRFVQRRRVTKQFWNYPFWNFLIDWKNFYSIYSNFICLEFLKFGVKSNFLTLLEWILCILYISYKINRFCLVNIALSHRPILKHTRFWILSGL